VADRVAPKKREIKVKNRLVEQQEPVNTKEGTEEKAASRMV